MNQTESSKIMNGRDKHGNVSMSKSKEQDERVKSNKSNAASKKVQK